MISWSEPSVLKMFIDTFVVFANSGGSFCAKYEFDRLVRIRSSAFEF